MQNVLEVPEALNDDPHLAMMQRIVTIELTRERKKSILIEMSNLDSPYRCGIVGFITLLNLFEQSRNMLFHIGLL